MNLITITLGIRTWKTTNEESANRFIKCFGEGEGFVKKSVPYEGKEIDNIISNLKLEKSW